MISNAAQPKLFIVRERTKEQAGKLLLTLSKFELGFDSITLS